MGYSSKRTLEGEGEHAYKRVKILKPVVIQPKSSGGDLEPVNADHEVGPHGSEYPSGDDGREHGPNDSVAESDADFGDANFGNVQLRDYDELSESESEADDR